MKRSCRRTRQVGVFGVAVVVAATLAACGTSGTGGGGAGSGRPSAVKSVAALLPPRVAKSGTLTVGILSGGSSALEYTSGSDIVGFDPDLAKAIGSVLGVKVKIEPATFNSLIAGVQAGRYDASLGGIADSREREKSVSFVNYANIGLALIVKKGNPAHIKGPDQLCGKSVAVITGGYPQTNLVPKLSSSCTKSAKPALRQSSFPDTNSAVLAVQSGRADCLYNNAAAAAYLLKKATGQFEQAGSTQILARAGIAFSKSNPQLGRAVQSALQSLMTSGRYAALAKRWNLTSSTISTASTNKALI